MSRFDLSTQAKVDLEETWTYISENSAHFADKTIDELISKFRLLAGNPKIGKFRHDLMVDLRLFSFKNYNIFYFQTDFGVEIYRVNYIVKDLDDISRTVQDAVNFNAEVGLKIENIVVFEREKT